ncbi:hypothetical protein [Photobacterium leiognathi]|uniref:hypothetical protein n=1 Tax=Photobacterium leiognathi TaxID=553611 RepID=UPI0002088064|nr:hypothetical protein [Photobacterium leiognathi]PSW48363.1 hypothetical protein CTM83_20240 [Photobacterium leiognathi subsp. mandapamensis]GAA03199.1 hypothetical protein PMSV_4124 [Photobacterium leiognathi subsp. mandapamensis svers.1.1.]
MCLEKEFKLTLGLKRTCGIRPVKAIAKNAYEAWYMRLGGCNYNGKLPRGKKFTKAIYDIKDKAFISVSKPKKLRSMND